MCLAFSLTHQPQAPKDPKALRRIAAKDFQVSGGGGGDVKVGPPLGRKKGTGGFRWADLPLWSGVYVAEDRFWLVCC